MINCEWTCDAQIFKCPHTGRCFCCLAESRASCFSRSAFVESRSLNMASGKHANVSPPAVVKVFSAGTAGCVADLVTFPLDTAKVRLQVTILSTQTPPLGLACSLKQVHVVMVLQQKSLDDISRGKGHFTPYRRHRPQRNPVAFTVQLCLSATLLCRV